MLPGYHEPSGFSSTYHRALFPNAARLPFAKPAEPASQESDNGAFYPPSIKLTPRMQRMSPSMPPSMPPKMDAPPGYDNEPDEDDWPPLSKLIRRDRH